MPLLEAVQQWEPGSFAVYVLDHAANDDEVALCKVAGIWREREGGYTSRLWYSTSLGELRPCSHGRLIEETQPELVSEVVFAIDGAMPQV
ncbi:hypothetical protein HR51_28785 [Burkholderia cepacia]|nr:hypothetical protein HR51_28785 [Burkholderia cepacia]